MSKIYMVVTVCQDKNHRTFTGRPSEEYEPGYYSYVVSANIGDNLKFALDCIGGLRVAHLCRTKEVNNMDILDIIAITQAAYIAAYNASKANEEVTA